jgi:hypothetical protein
MGRITISKPEGSEHVNQVSASAALVPQRQTPEEVAAPPSPVPHQNEERTLLPPELMAIVTPSLKVGAVAGEMSPFLEMKRRVKN